MRALIPAPIVFVFVVVVFWSRLLFFLSFFFVKCGFTNCDGGGCIVV